MFDFKKTKSEVKEIKLEILISQFFVSIETNGEKRRQT